jgi:tetratricopeptide (TPR) repeat protein
MLGRTALRSGNVALARTEFEAALHFDALRFRPDPQLNAIIRRVATGLSGVELADAARELGADAASTAPIAGCEVLFEHVHFNWEGNAAMARLLTTASRRALRVAGPMPPLLTDEQCAAELGFTAYGRELLAAKMALLTRKAPFTNQLTYREGQERLAAQQAAAHEDVGTPEKLQAVAKAVAGALERHPLDPAIADHLYFIETDLGHLDAAEALVARAAQLQPTSAVLLAQEADLKVRRHELAAGETRLLQATQEDPYYAAPWTLLCGVWQQEGRMAEGAAVLDARIAAMPANPYVRSARAMLMEKSGDAAGAEQLWRDILRRNPGDPGALEHLTVLLEQAGRKDAAFEVMQTAAKVQPRNYANNARLARLCAEKDDRPREAEALQALLESGPVQPNLCFGLARLLASLGRYDDAAVYVRRGRKIAVAQGRDDAVAEATALEAALAGRN